MWKMRHCRFCASTSEASQLFRLWLAVQAAATEMSVVPNLTRRTSHLCASWDCPHRPSPCPSPCHPLVPPRVACLSWSSGSPWHVSNQGRRLRMYFCARQGSRRIARGGRRPKRAFWKAPSSPCEVRPVPWASRLPRQGDNCGCAQIGHGVEERVQRLAADVRVATRNERHVRMRRQRWGRERNLHLFVHCTARRRTGKRRRARRASAPCMTHRPVARERVRAKGAHCHAARTSAATADRQRALALQRLLRLCFCAAPRDNGCRGGVLPHWQAAVGVGGRAGMRQQIPRLG